MERETEMERERCNGERERDEMEHDGSERRSK